jgi:hypothetical protein
MPLSDRPRFVRRLTAVWRLHHLAAGQDLTAVIWSGEGPLDIP